MLLIDLIKLMSDTQIINIRLSNSFLGYKGDVSDLLSAVMIDECYNLRVNSVISHPEVDDKGITYILIDCERIGKDDNENK